MSRSEIDFETKKEKFVSSQLAKQNNSKKNNQMVNNDRKEYMAQPRVKVYNKDMSDRLFGVGGRPPAFKSEEQLSNDIREFINLCYDTTTIPTVMGLATWLGCSRDTIYAHANDSRSPFSYLIKNFIDLCHLSLENGTIDGKVNPVTYIFMGKNYFGLSDSKDIKVTASSDNQSTPNAQETAEALQKQLQEEHITEATISEK